MGGLVIGQEVARQLGKRFIFAEKVDDRLQIRRNFRIKPGERILVVEDVITTGGSALKAIESVNMARGEVIGVLGLVDREEGGRAAIEATGRLRLRPAVPLLVRFLSDPDSD